MLGTWTLPAIILAAFLAAFLVVVLIGLLTVRIATGPIVSKRFWCPLKRQSVEVDFVADPAQPERYQDVLFCSAFEDPSRVTCDKRCLHLSASQTDPAPSSGGHARTPFIENPLMPPASPWRGSASNAERRILGGANSGCDRPEVREVTWRHYRATGNVASADHSMNDPSYTRTRG
jgi:hypothetical protein